MQQKEEQHYMGQLATALTRESGNLIDFHNIGGLAKTRIEGSFTGLWHHYSWREYMVRAVMVAVTLLAAYWGAQHSYTTSFVSGSLTFIGAHYVAAKDTISRRQNMKDKAQVHFEKICKELDSNEQLKDRIKQIHDFEFPLTKRLDATRNLFWTLSIMENIDTFIQGIKKEPLQIQKENLDNFLQEDLDLLIEHFKTHKELPQKISNSFSY